MTEADRSEAKDISNRIGLLLETSAQLFRLVGDAGLKGDLQSVLDRFSIVGSSYFAYQEFARIVNGLYGCIERGLGKLPGQDRARPIADLWEAATFELSPFISGGPKLLSFLTASIIQTFNEGVVSPRKLANWCAGQKRAALACFYDVNGTNLRDVAGAIVDASSCCCWRGQAQERYDPDPHPTDCRLKSMCVDELAAFLASLETLANSDVSEADWITKNLPRLRELRSCDLLRFVRRNANPLGDTIIFLETPQPWHILTRDRAFGVLQNRHRPNVRVYYVRSPREQTYERCAIFCPPEMTVADEGFLVNHSSTGVAILAGSKIGDRGDSVRFVADRFDNPQQAVLVWRSKVGDGWLHGLRLSGKRPRRS